MNYLSRMQLAPWSLRHPSNLAAFGFLWIVAIVTAVTVEFSWRALGIAVLAGIPAGILTALLPSLGRILGYAVLFGAMGYSRDTWAHHTGFGFRLLIDLQFLAVAMTIAMIVHAGVNRLRPKPLAPQGNS